MLPLLFFVRAAQTSALHVGLVSHLSLFLIFDQEHERLLAERAADERESERARIEALRARVAEENEMYGGTMSLLCCSFFMIFFQFSRISPHAPSLSLKNFSKSSPCHILRPF